MAATISDEEIVKKWNEARRHRHGRYGNNPTSLGRRISEQIVDELEAAGVTEEDIDRLFPEDMQYRKKQQELKDAMIAEYGPFTEAVV